MSSSNSPCAACKFLRRKCTQECPFAPYFPPDNPQRFSCVHRVFGASNVAKLLNELNPSQREDAVKSLAYEAEARLRDPVYGCIGYISVLQHKLRQIQSNIHSAKKELSNYLNPQAMQALQAMLENPNMIQPNGLVMPQQHQIGNPFQGNNNIGFSPYGNTNVMVAPQHNQMGIGDQRQDLLEAQQLAAEQEFMRLNGLEGMGGNGGDNGFNQMGGGPELALGTFENVGPYEIQQQHQHEHHHHHSHHQHQHQQQHHVVEEQLLLLPQQTQPQEHQLSLQQPQPQGGDRRSVGPST